MTNNIYDDIQSKSEAVIEWLSSLIRKGYPLSAGVSFGKDSNVVLVLLLEAIKRCLAEGVNITQCYVTHSNTLIENPAMSIYTDTMLEELELYCMNNNLPLKVIKATPSISSSFMYATIGRGKLPRFANSAHRECSVDWKVRPQEKALKTVIEQSEKASSKPVVCLHGSRFEESSSRSGRMSSRGDANTALVTQSNGVFSNAPIADWEMTDVWSLLMACGKDRNQLYQTFVDDFNWCLKLYKDANEGACAIITGNNGSKSACGARFGCAWCPPASSNGDKSMESLIASDSEYDYLKGINRFGKLLVNTQYDLSKRDWLGRTLSPAGYVRIRPDNYSSSFRRQLLRYLLTLDIMEEERAEQHTVNLQDGLIDDNLINQRLCSPQFQFVTPDQIVSIDFAWSLQRDFDYAFPALREWYEIRHLGRRYPVPNSDRIAPVKIPEARWFHVGTFDHPWMIDGLRDPLGEAVNLKRKPGTKPYIVCNDLVGTGGQRKVVSHETADELTIDREDAGFFVICEFEELYFKSLNMGSKDSLLYLLDRGLVKLGKGTVAKYDLMARRAHYYERLKSDLNTFDLLPMALEKSITDKEHKELLENTSSISSLKDDLQQDLFLVA